MDDQIPLPPAADSLSARAATALRELHVRAEAVLAARREAASKIETDLTARFDAIAAGLAEAQAGSTIDEQQAASKAEAKRIAAELEAARAAMTMERAEWQSQREALEKERAVAETQRSTFEGERAAWQVERSAFETERATLTKEKKSWDAERAAWEAERNTLAAKATKLEADLQRSEAAERSRASEQRTAEDDIHKQLADVKRELLGERSAQDARQSDWSAERTELQSQLDQSRQKFELALEDVQRFRARATELEQELARRPEIDKTDSAELVALRAERDALAKRLEQLERAPAPGRSNADTEQEIADLQRRFELAVEDVRDLKSKNAKLEAALASPKPHSGGAVDSDSMDWESQKRRLLASLEGNGEGDDVSQKERATIESTIEMTDAVVAEKDQIIAELKGQLETAGEHSANTAQASREAEVTALLDADTVIAEHRRKIAALEQEVHGKLREAELELSVERAKIARQRAELEDLRNELESQRQMQTTPGAPSSPGAPRRRWLAKLGLAGEEEA